MEFSRPEYWIRQPFPSPGDLPNPGIEPRSPELQADSLPAEPQGKPMCMYVCVCPQTKETEMKINKKDYIKVKIFCKLLHREENYQESEQVTY